MLEFNALILKFGKKGEKSGWTYIEVPEHITQALMPGNKKAFRVKGMLDGFGFAGIALTPMGEGEFIMALKSELRKEIGKREGATLHVCIAFDPDYKVEVPADLQEGFDLEPEAEEFFYSLSKSHRDYFIKWIDSAKTPGTRINRTVNTINAMIKKMDYGQMIRSLKRSKA